MKRTRRLNALVAVAALTLAGVVALPATAAPGTGRLLGTDAAGGNLLDISTGTGTAVVIGNMGVGQAPALATDPTTGIVYVATGSGRPVLYTVNLASAVAALVGNTGLGFAAVGGMDFDAAGTLYAAVNIAGDGGTGSDHLATLNTITGQATIIGPFGTCAGIPPLPVNGAGSCTIEGIEGIAFDAAGALWGVHTQRGSAGAPGLYSINRATGAATFVTAIVDSDGNPPSGGLSSIQFSCDGTLFGGTARGFGSPDGGFLVTVNPASGLFSFVGAVSATNGSSLGALAFEDPSCGAPPLSVFWFAPTSAALGENHDVTLTVHNPAQVAQPVSFSLDEMIQIVHGEPCIGGFFCWDLDYQRNVSLNGAPYVEGGEIVETIPPGATVDFVFTINEKWAWIEPWNPERLIFTGLKLVPVLGDLLAFSELLLQEVSQVPSISTTYELVANSSSVVVDVTAHVPLAKQLMLVNSFLSGVPASELTFGGAVPTPLTPFLLAAEAALLAASEALYLAAADPQDAFMEIAVPESIEFSKACDLELDRVGTDVANSAFDLVAVVRALRDSYIRYDAAEDAGSFEWMAIHQGLIGQYSEEAASITDQLIAALSPILVDVSIPEGDKLEALGEQIVQQGLPAPEPCLLTALGFSAPEIEALGDALVFFIDNHVVVDAEAFLAAFASSVSEVADSVPDLPEGVILALDIEEVEIEDDEFDIEGSFTVGPITDGIDPLAENVMIAVGTFASVIPAGSFELTNSGSFVAFEFEGNIAGVDLEVEIREFADGTFDFEIEGEEADLAGTVNPVAVALIIGNNAGATAVTAEFDDDDDDD